MADITEHDILAHLSRIIEKKSGKDIVSNGMVTGLVIKDGNVAFALEINPADAADNPELAQQHVAPTLSESFGQPGELEAIHQRRPCKLQRPGHAGPHEKPDGCSADTDFAQPEAARREHNHQRNASRVTEQ